MTSQAFYGYTFGYNNSGSVTDVKIGTQELENYSCDANGNILTASKNDKTISYAYGSNQQLVKTVPCSHSQPESVQYISGTIQAGNH